VPNEITAGPLKIVTPQEACALYIEHCLMALQMALQMARIPAEYAFPQQP
jgi:hypothetical protein